MADGPDDAGAATYVLVEVAGTRYGLDVAWVHGVVATGSVTRVPGAGTAIRGVINVRGRVLPLGDLVVALGDGAASSGEDPATALLLGPVGGDVPEFALLGEVLDVVELDDERMEPPPPFGLGAAARLVTGVARPAEGGLALVLDPERLLASMGAGDGAK